MDAFSVTLTGRGSESPFLVVSEDGETGPSLLSVIGCLDLRLEVEVEGAAEGTRQRLRIEPL